MKISPNDLFKAKKFPKWIANHPVFTKVDSIGKVFPGIGLPNSTDDKLIDGVRAASKAAHTLLGTIESNIDKRISGLQKFAEAHPKMGKARKAKLDDLVATLTTVKATLSDNKDKCVVVNKDKVNLKMPTDITIDGEKKPLFRESESIFRVYNKLNDLLKEPKLAKMRALEETDPFKAFSMANVPSKKYKVVFSSEGAEGAWDIATMSQRGVKSCQSWEGGAYKYGVIGSMADPFVGIIYLTTGEKFNEFGSKMINRCIVRFVVDGIEKKPYIVLDNMYPSFNANVLEQFKEFIKARVGNKFDVEYAATLYAKPVYANSYIPMTKVRKELEKFSSKSPHDPDSMVMAYQDIKFPSNKPPSNSKEALFDKNSKKKTDKFVQHFTAAASEAIKTIDANLF